MQAALVQASGDAICTMGRCRPITHCTWFPERKPRKSLPNQGREPVTTEH